MKLLRRFYNLGDVIEELKEHFDDEKCRGVLNDMSADASGLPDYRNNATSSSEESMEEPVSL